MEKWFGLSLFRGMERRSKTWIWTFMET